MYHVRFNGNRYQAGYAWGARLNKHGITLENCPTFTPDAAMKQFAWQCKAEYKKYYPELLEEIQGIADGQQLPVHIIETILFSMYCIRFENRCSCFAFSNGHEVLFARNSDFLVSLEKENMNCLYHLDGTYAFHGNTTAYVEMEDGVNEHGLAAGLCFVYPKFAKPGLNAGMLTRYILEKCKTTAEAIDALKGLPIGSAQTITLADAGGSIAVVECNAEKIAVIRPETDKNYVAATNSFVSSDMLAYRNTDIDDWRADERYNTISTALSSHQERFSLTFAQDVLAGKHGFTCQYNRKTNADTVWSVIYDLKRSQIWRVEGNPMRKPFKEDTRRYYNELV